MSPLETLNHGSRSVSTDRAESSVRQFGAKLRALRMTRGMTLVELADTLGYGSHSHLSAVETGKKQPTVSLVLDVSRFFKVSTDLLLDDRLKLSRQRTEN